jgi:glycogen debranching enzyme
VVDVNHQAGTKNPALQSNQIFAVGGLTLSLLDGDRARRVLEAVDQNLWTPAGLRSLAPRGGPFQAWSVGEASRLDRVVLAKSPAKSS